MRNLDWVKMKEFERILKMSDMQMFREIEEFASPNLCNYCEELFGECSEDDEEESPCYERISAWADCEHIDLEHKGYYGLHVYDEKQKLYKGVMMTNYGGRYIPFWGKTPDELRKNFRLAVDEYIQNLESLDKELTELAFTTNLHFARLFREGMATAFCTYDKEKGWWNGLFFSGCNSVTRTCFDLEALHDEFVAYAKEGK